MRKRGDRAQSGMKAGRRRQAAGMRKTLIEGGGFVHLAFGGLAEEHRHCIVKPKAHQQAAEREHRPAMDQKEKDWDAPLTIFRERKPGATLRKPDAS